jgi:hypothetical protein
MGDGVVVKGLGALAVIKGKGEVEWSGTKFLPSYRNKPQD